MKKLLSMEVAAQAGKLEVPVPTVLKRDTGKKGGLLYL
jgi:hypothetical protein